MSKNELRFAYLGPGLSETIEGSSFVEIKGKVMTASRFIPPGKWQRKPQAKHFRIRDESKARTAERKWLKKSKSK